jgi:methyl-accepting chemotaxis protein
MLASLSIAARVYAGFAVVLALLGGIAAYTAVSTHRAEAVFRGYDETARQTLFVAEQVDHLAAVRLARVTYALHGEAAARDEALATLDHMQSDLAAATTVFAGDDDAGARARLADVAAILGEYRATFGEQVAGVEGADLWLGKLRDLGAEIGDRLGRLLDGAYADAEADAAYYAGVAQRELLLARYAAFMFLEAGDPKNWDLARARLTDARKRAESLVSRLNEPARRDMAREVTALLDAYAEGLDATKSAVTQRETAAKALLVDVGPRASAAFEALMTDVAAHQTALSESGLAAVAGARTVAIGAGVGAFLLGAALAAALGLWIARAVAAMADAMGRMAQGDFDVAVAGAGHDHELGRMARALEVFRAEGREMRRLGAEREARAARDAAATAEREALQHAVAGVVDRAAAGDFAGRVEARFADDGLNGFARQLNGLLDTVGAAVGETSAVTAALARGDLTAEMAGAFRGAFAALQRDMNGAVARLRDTMVDIQTVTGAMGKATSEIAAGAGDLSGRAENQAASLEQIAATMEQMAATVKTNADNASAATRLGSEAAERADRGGRVVADAVEAMSQIADGSRKIADIVSVIDGFAFQTNLLALNAAVEAARAGEAGKGFAVVASEVRMLAQRSAEAARDIKALIDASSTSVKDGVRLVQETGAALREIVEAIGRTSDTISEISAASREQSSGVDEISAAIASMDQITQQNSALAEQSASAAKGLAAQAARLTELTAFFTVAVRARRAADPSAAAFDADAAADRASARRRAAS